jgi:exopolyphosphatase/guanosine-5'-triphosphate,3'-diphosphate pyrophosphatase
MNVAAVDIGTNSVRLLILDRRGRELERRVIVTGLGRGIAQGGRLTSEGMERTLAVLARYEGLLRRHRVGRTRAVATSATRDADNAAEFLDAAAAALAVEPEVISGSEEAALTFTGTLGPTCILGPALVIDIGGGSTEFAFGEAVPEFTVSVAAGSVRLTDGVLPHRPATETEIDAARAEVDRVLAGVDLPGEPVVAYGVAGTFTSLAAIALGLPAYDRTRVHGSTLSRRRLAALIVELGGLTVEETAAIPSLDPARAPVILAGAVMAERALTRVGLDAVTVSERDLLDAVAESLL